MIPLPARQTHIGLALMASGAVSGACWLHTAHHHQPHPGYIFGWSPHPIDLDQLSASGFPRLRHQSNSRVGVGVLMRVTAAVRPLSPQITRIEGILPMSFTPRPAPAPPPHTPRRMCCAWTHPVVSTAVDTHRVKPSSGLSLSLSLSTPPSSVHSPSLSCSPSQHPPRVSPILTIKLQLCTAARGGGARNPPVSAVRAHPTAPPQHAQSRTPVSAPHARPENP